MSGLDSLLAGVPKAVPMGAGQERALVKKAQAGSSAAARALASANIRLVAYLVARIRRPDWIQIDDLVQEGTLGLMHAISMFDPDRGRFRPYAGRWIQDYAAKFVRRTARTSAACDVPDSPSHDATPEEAVAEAETRAIAASAVAAAIRTLPKQEARVMVGALADVPHAAIGKKLRYTRQNVTRLHKTARAKLVDTLRKDRLASRLFG